MKLQRKPYVWKQTLCFLLIRIIYTYVTVITLDGLYAQGGGYHISYNLQKDIVSCAVMVVLAIYYSMRPMYNSFMSVSGHLLFIIYYIPINAGYAINDMSESFLVLTTIYFFTLISLLTRRQPSYVARDDETLLGDRRIEIFCLLVCIFFILFKLSYNGLEFNLSIQGDYVYSNREEFNTNLGLHSGRLLGYLYELLSSIVSTIAPIYLFISLRKKRYGMVCIAIITILSEYSLNSMKGTLFGLVMVVAVYIAYIKGFLKDYRKFFNLIFLGMMLFCLIERMVTRVGPFYFLMIRRTMFSPAWLNWLYYDYFSQHPKVWLTDSVIGLQKLLPHVYDVSPLTKISEAYFGGTMTSPNTGLFGAAYMQMGLLGIIAQPLLIYFLLKWTDKVLAGYGIGVIIVLASDTVLKMCNVPVLRTDFVLSFIVIIFIFKWLQRIKMEVRSACRREGKNLNCIT